MFSEAVFLNAKKSQGCVLKDERVNRWTEPSLHIYIHNITAFSPSVTLFSKTFSHNVFFGL